MRFPVAGFIAVLAFPLLLGGGTYKAEAQEADASVETARYDDWILRCVKTEQKSCRMVQEGYVEKNGRKARILTMTVDPHRLRINGPLGFDLTKGMILRANDFERALPYRVCTKTGCAGGTDLDEALVRAFRKAEQAQVVLTGLEGKTVTLNLSLKGFTKAHREMMTAE